MRGDAGAVRVRDLDRFGQRPYGWHDWETVLLVVRLVMKGELSLTGSGGTLSPDKIYAAIDGKLADCCAGRGPNGGMLREAGIGKPL